MAPSDFDTLLTSCPIHRLLRFTGPSTPLLSHGTCVWMFGTVVDPHRGLVYLTTHILPTGARLCLHAADVDLLDEWRVVS